MPGNRNTQHHRRGRSIPARPFDLPKSSARRPHQVAPELREAVFARAGGLCELCGERLQADWHWHHRKLRSRGGEDSVSNGVALHPLCHRRVHGHVAWAESVGLMVRSTDDPGRIRLALHGETWVRLVADGTYYRTGKSL
jgi:hypothetical protein